MITEKCGYHYGKWTFSSLLQTTSSFSSAEAACQMSSAEHQSKLAAEGSFAWLTRSREGETAPVFHAEFGRFMLEATPGKPWGIGFKGLLDVEPNMKLRCRALLGMLGVWKLTICPDGG